MFNRAASLKTGELSIAVMAHPKRAHFVDELVPELKNATVVWDEHNDRWDTGRRSMLAYNPDALWHMVVQDDAILCRDFVSGVRQALAAVPAEHPVAFYMGNVRPNLELVQAMVRAADEAESHWIAMKGPWWGVAVAVPTSLIDEMIHWCDQRPDIANYDKRMSRYFEHEGVDCWYSLPSLVDHRVGDENPSLIPGRLNAPSRTACRFIGDVSPLELDWTTPPASAPATAPVTPVSGPCHTRRWKHADGRVRSTTIGSQLDRACAMGKGWEEIAHGAVDRT